MRDSGVIVLPSGRLLKSYIANHSYGAGTQDLEKLGRQLRDGYSEKIRRTTMTGGVAPEADGVVILDEIKIDGGFAMKVSCRSFYVGFVVVLLTIHFCFLL